MKRGKERKKGEERVRFLSGMSVKGRALLAILFVLLLLGSMWLQGSLGRHWEYCLKGYILQKDQPVYVSSLVSSGNGSEEQVAVALRECPGQRFQVSVLLAHLQAAPISTDDILLQPYLSSWDELIKFMEALGPMVGLISQEIEVKTSIIRDLTQEEKRRERAYRERDYGTLMAIIGASDTHDSEEEQDGAYFSVRSMIGAELSRGVVNFERQTDSGCRTLLRLHRALLWLQLFLQKLSESPVGQSRLRSPSELCREAYQHTLAPYHTWWVRRAAELAFLAMPERGFFYRLVCVQHQDEAAMVLQRVVRAISEVYQRTQNALEEHGMLDLP
ncbi:glycolipid transfer protein domain-containing protein 2 [Chanos chanos]|uniref:Glycolipid transfer protein domain-containing protein 2 n=1 Tax=Chanos chanos TaxID=29144 RepID=A0A6J2W1P3_CHACN|nr:ceramide-1-phosphate transfer protein-like [Chanos chanos]